MKMHVTVVPLAILILGWVAGGNYGQQLPQEFKSREFMRRKLTHAQNVLQGIALEDFDQIAKNARALTLLSKAAEWQVLPSSEYKHHGEEFRRITEAMEKLARDQNLDGAALKYVEMTLNCVNCHKFIRSIPKDPEKRPAVKPEKPNL